MFYKFITNRYKLYLFMLCYSFNIPKDMIRTCSLQTALKQSVHTFSCALDGIFASNVNAIEYWKVKNETSKYISHVTSFLPVFLSEDRSFYRMWEIYRNNKRLSVASCEGKGKSGHYIDKIIWMKKDISYVFPDGVLISLWCIWPLRSWQLQHLNNVLYVLSLLVLKRHWKIWFFYKTLTCNTPLWYTCLCSSKRKYLSYSYCCAM